MAKDREKEQEPQERMHAVFTHRGGGASALLLSVCDTELERVRAFVAALRVLDVNLEPRDTVGATG